MSKKIVSLLLVISVMCTMVASIPFAVSAEDTGTDVTETTTGIVAVDKTFNYTSVDEATADGWVVESDEYAEFGIVDGYPTLTQIDQKVLNDEQTSFNSSHTSSNKYILPAGPVAEDEENRTRIITEDGKYTGNFKLELDGKFNMGEGGYTVENASGETINILAAYASLNINDGANVAVYFRVNYNNIIVSNAASVTSSTMSHGTTPLTQYSNDQEVSFEFEFDTVDNTVYAVVGEDTTEGSMTSDLDFIDAFKFTHMQRHSVGSYSQFNGVKVTVLDPKLGTETSAMLEQLPAKLVSDVTSVTETSITLPVIDGVEWTSVDETAATIDGSTVTLIPSETETKEAVLKATFTTDGIRYSKEYTMTLAQSAESEGDGTTGEELTYGDFTYTVADGAATITGCSADVTEVVIPAEIEGVPVTTIGEKAFYERTDITSLTIPPSITNVNSNAFYNCTALTKVYITDLSAWCGIVFADDSAYVFWHATEPTTLYLNGSPLEDLVIPEDVTHPKMRVFCNVDSLKTAVIHDNVKTLPFRLFQDCSNLLSADIGNGVTTMGASVFNDCTSLKSIVIPDSVTNFGGSMFWKCSSLESVTLPETVLDIGLNCFRDCKKLTTIDLSRILIYQKNALMSAGLTGKIELSEDTIAIGEYAFYDTDVTEVTIPESVTEIYTTSFPSATLLNVYDGSYAHTFAVENGLNYNVLESTGSEEDSGSSLEIEIKVQEEVAEFEAEVANWVCESYTYGDITGLVLTDYTGTQADVSIPVSLEVDGVSYPVLKLDDGLFEGNTGINSVTLSSSVKVIGERAFADALNLVCVVTNEGLAEIGADAFAGCSSFNSIILYSGVTTIGNNAFANCENLTVYCVEGTPGHNYVVANNINYSIISENAEPLIYTADGVSYYISNGEAVAVSYDDTVTTEVVVPATINGYPVTSIGTVFSTSDITSIVLPNSLKRLEENAFFNCLKLVDVSIPNSVEYIGKTAFKQCVSLESIVIPDSVTVLNDGAFYNCVNLKNVVLSKNLQELTYNTFAYCTDLTTVEIPYGITSIGSSAFIRCTGLKEIVIPDSVTTLSTSVFSGCINIEKIVLPDSITSIGTGTFMNCNNLKEITLPVGLTNISEGLLKNSGITHITIPDGVTTIGEGAFASSPNLQSVIIPDSVVSIENTAFANCPMLTDVTMGNGVTTIGEKAFLNCTKLRSVIIPESVTTMYTNSFTFDNDNNRLLVYADSYAHNFALENNLNYSVLGEDEESEVIMVDGIAYRIVDGEAIAIWRRGTITDVVIPETVNGCPVVEIKNVFINCRTLTSVTLPEGLKIIGANAFKNCSNLTSITIPGSVTAIGDYAFYGTSVTDVTIPASVTSLGKYAFASCHSMTNLAINANITSIGDYTFANARCLTSVTIPESVTSIGKYAFINCIRLADLTLSNVESIDEKAFYNCNSLVNIIIPDTVTSIGKEAFAESDRLTSITIPGSVTAIGQSAFSGCNRLESVVISEGVTQIGYNAFADCINLADVTIPEGVTIIRAAAFAGCEGLNNVVVPESVTTMDVTSFPLSTILLVHENSPAHTYADENGLLYSVIIDGAESEFYTVDGIEYYIYNNEAIVIACNDDTLTTVTIPETVEGYPVTEIRYAFDGFSNLQSVTLPESIKVIGNNAFRNCINLTTVNMPGTLTKISNNAFYGCSSLSNITIPETVTSIGDYAFYYCGAVTELNIPASVATIGSHAFHGIGISTLVIPETLTAISDYAFRNCSNLASVTIPETVTTIGKGAFSNCNELLTVSLPDSIASMDKTSFASTTILLVKDGSYADTFAGSMNMLHFVVRETNNPEITYGSGISGTVTYTDGTAVEGATVEIVYDDGVVKESVTTDADGAYNFTYAEVGKYIIKVTDENGNAGSENVSVKRMNVFDVYVAGETDITIKQGYTVSGTVAEGSATVTITDENGIVIDTIVVTDGTFTFDNIPNGSYIIKIETENGTVVEEIDVFNGSVTDIAPVVKEESSTLTGVVTDEKNNVRVWANVTLYNSDNVAVSTVKTDKQGKYEFSKIPCGEYSIVAESNDVRKHNKHDYDRSVVLKGYGYINITEVGSYDVNITVSKEKQKNAASIEGKVTAQGESQISTVTLSDEANNEIAVYQTTSNGKYKFTNVADGTYIITVETSSKGFGMTKVFVAGGTVYGNTDIYVKKSDFVHEHETKMDEIPDCSTRDEALAHKDKIIEEKNAYDSLPEKERRQFSKSYVEKLNKLAELIAYIEYVVTGDVEGVEIKNGGLVSNTEELENEDKVGIEINVEKRDEVVIGEDGVKTEDDFIQQSIEDNAGDKTVVQHYDISMKKGKNDKESKDVDNIKKDTDTKGKIEITMPIPEEHRGHKNYSVIHVHNGEVMSHADKDNNPDTVTFEVDKFSTFAIAYTDEELTEDVGEVTTPVEISIGNVKGRAGQTVEVPVYVNNNTGILGMMLNFTYDENLTLVSVEQSVGEEDSALENHDFLPSGDLSLNPFNISWDGVDADNTNGKIAKISYTLPADAENDTEYSISASYKTGDVYDNDLNDIVLSIINGSITVQNFTYGDINDDGTINMKDVTLLRRAVVGGYGVELNRACDVNGDDASNMKDVTVLRRYVVGGYDVTLAE